MIGVGLVVSAGDSTWRLWVGHGLFIGLLGNAGINAPGYIYVSRWFDRRRGTALALISSGQYVAGAIWPPVFERGIALFGWHDTMLVFAAVVVLAVVPVALLILRAPPEASHAPLARGERTPRVLGLPPVFWLWRPSRAVCRWRCRKGTWWHCAATAASLLRTGQSCCRCCLDALSSAGNSGDGCRIASAGYAPYYADRFASSSRCWASCLCVARPGCSLSRPSSVWVSAAGRGAGRALAKAATGGLGVVPSQES
jgi:MFS family permease